MTTTTNSVQNNAVFLLMSVGRLRTRKKLSTSLIQTGDIDESLLHVSKDILESSALKAVAEFDNGVRTWVRARSLPSPFNKGIILLPVRMLAPVLEKITSAQVERQQLIESFLQAYDRCKHEAEGKLGAAFDERDYPSPDEVRKTFFFETQVFELSTPGRLKAVSRELYQQELCKLQNMWTEATATVTSVLLEEMKKLTSHIHERLQPGEDGKPKIFRDSVITNLTTWLDLFSARNLTNDEELGSLVEKARRMVQGLDPENIRDNDSLRKEIADGFQQLAEEVDTAIINAPIRAIDLDQEAV